MYARLVKAQFKPGYFDFATRMIEDEVIPLLKKQHGFRDEISFFNKDMKEGYAISFWDEKLDLEKYERDIYPQVKEKMAEAFETPPVARDFEISNSTWYDIHAA